MPLVITPVKFWGEEDEEVPQNKWYQEEKVEAQTEPKSFIPGSEITFIDEELSIWSHCESFGERVSFKQLETKLNKKWSH